MSISQTCRHTDVHPYVHLHIISTSNIPATPWHGFWPKHRSKQQQVGHYMVVLNSLRNPVHTQIL